VFLGTALLTSSGKPLLTESRTVWLVVVALSLANSIALHTNIRRYTTGVRVQGINLDSPREWWWSFLPDFLSPNVVWLVGTAAFATLIWFLLLRVTPFVMRTLNVSQPRASVESRLTS